MKKTRNRALQSEKQKEEKSRKDEGGEETRGVEEMERIRMNKNILFWDNRWAPTFLYLIKYACISVWFMMGGP